MSDERGLPRLTDLAKTIGFEVTEFTEGSCIVECTVREDHLNMGGVAHGGIHATLLDSAMGGTLVSTLAEEEWGATAQIDIPRGRGSSIFAGPIATRREHHSL